jgi:HD-GYP domain-containing protein (c-di-GMP phosphodiesterase class II)
MVSNRAYRNSLTPEQAIEIMRQGAGKQFDPNLLQIFIDILPDIQKEIEEFERQQENQPQV